MSRTLTTKLALFLACQLLMVADARPQLLQKVDPNEGRPKSGMLLGTAAVKLTVDQNGVPLAFDSAAPLPDYVVKALAQWRYSPYQKEGGAVPFAVTLSIPVARPITPGMENHFAPSWHPESTEVGDALAQGLKLDETAATALEANLPDAEALGNPRTSLLVSYTNQAAANPDKARTGRVKILKWLVEHYPQDDILGSSYAIVNRDGEPLADALTSSVLAQLWLNAINQYPSDGKVTTHALRFFEVLSPEKAMAILNKVPPGWKDKSRWAAGIYGLGALGVTALDPSTGNPSAVGDPPVKAAIRSAILKTQDTEIVLGGLWTMTTSTRLLAQTSQVPPDYGAFCQALLNRAKELYPETTQSCDLTPRATDNADKADSQITVSAKVAEAINIKKVAPSYPAEARNRGIQGSVTFVVIIDKAGKIKELEAQSGPFALYASSLEAVQKWTYKSTLFGGKPVEIITHVVVNYTLGR